MILTELQKQINDIVKELEDEAHITEVIASNRRNSSSEFIIHNISIDKVNKCIVFNAEKDEKVEN